ncbi:Multicopper oxidase with three cupredoxin domains (includes cell division protein FtsP and spore coat protein CotA) [Pseudomonas benzenivorans]|nr:multicopper oxidase [Pseudomonas benzenivorans]SDH03341.1 Multicopper oxidase with three cupredoxin domains (includes cell division protein FtsP and spore coat protein CotA) [Pseudomonas benzenivorans]
MFTRRTFLKYTGGTVLTLFAINRFGVPVAIAQIPGGSLDPGLVPKFQTPLLIPPVMPKAARFTQLGGKRVDYYEIALRQLSQQILPAGLPATTVWGYGAVSNGSRRGLLLHNAPSLTIEATWNTPVRVKWINELKDDAGNFLPHLLPVDPTLHWANPPGGSDGRDERPTFSSTPAPYSGPVPMVTHVHGAVGVGDESDGYAEAWYLPDASDIPAEFAREGSWYEFFAGKAAAKFGETWGPGFATFQYPNLNRASTLWYHDHTLGMTRLNVYAGPAGFYLVRGGPAGDATLLDTRSGGLALLPGPAPKANDKFPPNKTYYEIPLAIQDRSFNADGSLFYPDSRAFFDEIAGPFIPDSDLSPLWNPEFFGNMLMVNGNTWPFHSVEQVRYRLRLLNGCQSRFLILDFNAIPGVEVWQIGNEGGFLAAPVNLTADHGNRLLMGLAERADLIVDFSQVPPGNYVLANVGPDEPFSGGEPDGDFDIADPDSTGQVMQLRVVPALAADPSTPPQFLQLPAITPLPEASVTRPLVLLEEMSAFFDDAPAEALLGTLAGDPAEAPAAWNKRLWMEPVSENPALGATEVWELYNATGDAHPMHIHEVAFEVIDRQDILVDEQAETVQLAPGSLPTPAEPWETGFKDTVIAYPGQVTRLRAQFNTPGQFVWHCHIVEHEDNEMMRPYRIGPLQPGQPD